ncbi:beta/gamma crystallin domain-containing protein [Nonomuraea rubra]|uniref:Streptomyces killer toxin-like beta/gamma crystallin domain-containing protein n=1 Tax=Nonomuraea rubra TaxID=46180 RepID=A0A7X0P4A1_9ACTN|nr:beta/gamma crystallin domain-containing protein [Nonomuraea rubra]MBB6554824.1 hypothetical protein [Nonomuraea rubra]
MRTLAVLSSAALAASIIGVTATPALAIDNVRCSDGAGYTEIHNEKRHCFANAGWQTVYIANVHHVKAGNNRIMISWYTTSGASGGGTMEKWQEQDFSPRVIIKRITIL